MCLYATHLVALPLNMLTDVPLALSMNVMQTVAAPADQNAQTVDLDSSPLVREMMHTGLDSETISTYISAQKSYSDTSKFMELLND